MYWIIIIGFVVSLLPMMVMSAHSENNDNRIHQQVQKRLTCKMPITDPVVMKQMLEEEITKP